MDDDTNKQRHEVALLRLRGHQRTGLNTPWAR
jgi:hypothetical protein